MERVSRKSGRIINGPARKAVSVYTQERGFNCFADNMIKLSVNKIKWTGFLARNGACFL